MLCNLGCQIIHVTKNIKNDFLLLCSFYSDLLYNLLGYFILQLQYFKIQKELVITYSRRRDSCQGLFKKLNILSLPSQYIFSLLLFLTKDMDLFKTNFSCHNI
jgi:hypothetical protein